MFKIISLIESNNCQNTNVIQQMKQSHFFFIPYAIPSHHSIKPEKVAFIIVETS